jgi:hypothetical protein
MTVCADSETVAGRIARATSIIRVRRETAARNQRLGGTPEELLERFRCATKPLLELLEQVEAELG